MTGGIVPKPFDSIIPVEKIKYYPSERKPTHIVVDHEVKKFSFIRFAGEDYNLKDVVIKRGELIQPKHIMALTTLGIKNLYVKKKPKIIFFGTGDEIVDYKKKNISNWQVRNSNNHYITSFGKSLHYQIIDGGVIKDNEQRKLKEKLKKSLKSIVTEARERWDLQNVTIIHRIGELKVNDQIVLVVTTSKHRQAAFESCHFIMDYLKTDAPFWKKESTEQKEEWVESRESDYKQKKRWQS